MGENRLGEVAKEAFSSGVETTFPCEQITIGVTSFGELLYQRRSQRRPKQKRDLYSTECILESQKTNRPRREAPRRNVMESKHTEAAPALRAADHSQICLGLLKFSNGNKRCIPLPGWGVQLHLLTSGSLNFQNFSIFLILLNFKQLYFLGFFSYSLINQKVKKHVRNQSKSMVCAVARAIRVKKGIP